MYDTKQEDCFFLHSDSQHYKISINSPCKIISLSLGHIFIIHWLIQQKYGSQLIIRTSVVLWFAMKKEATFLSCVKILPNSDLIMFVTIL